MDEDRTPHLHAGQPGTGVGAAAALGMTRWEPTHTLRAELGSAECCPPVLTHVYVKLKVR